MIFYDGIFPVYLSLYNIKGVENVQNAFLLKAKSLSVCLSIYLEVNREGPLEGLQHIWAWQRQQLPGRPSKIKPENYKNNKSSWKAVKERSDR